MKNKLKLFFATLVWCVMITSTTFAISGILTTSVKPSISDSDISKMGSDVLGYVQFIGWGIAIGMILYVGIKYLMASANDKAELKNGAIKWVIGALVIGAATTIFDIVTDIFSKAAQ